MLLLRHSHTHFKAQPFQIEVRNNTIRSAKVNAYGKAWPTKARLSSSVATAEDDDNSHPLELMQNG